MSPGWTAQKCPACIGLSLSVGPYGACNTCDGYGVIAVNQVTGAIKPATRAQSHHLIDTSVEWKAGEDHVSRGRVLFVTDNGRALIDTEYPSRLTWPIGRWSLVDVDELSAASSVSEHPEDQP
jgi:hypothetical protein